MNARLARTIVAAAVCAAFALPARAQAPATGESTRPLPSGLELLHLTPNGQPPLAYLDVETFGQLRDEFNADTAITRVALLVSPSCPYCRRGVQAVAQALADSATTRVKIYVVWMHVTHGDREAPNSVVLAELPDARAVQFWDPYRLLSKVMIHDYPSDTAMAMADTAGAGPPVIWDFVAMWRPGVRWGDDLPIPDFAGHPIVDVVESFRWKLGELTHPAARTR